jgi:hypothetical protein
MCGRQGWSTHEPECERDALPTSNDAVVDAIKLALSNAMSIKVTSFASHDEQGATPEYDIERWLARPGKTHHRV